MADKLYAKVRLVNVDEFIALREKAKEQLDALNETLDKILYYEADLEFDYSKPGKSSNRVLSFPQRVSDPPEDSPR